MRSFARSAGHSKPRNIDVLVTGSEEKVRGMPASRTCSDASSPICSRSCIAWQAARGTRDGYAIAPSRPASSRSVGLGGTGDREGEKPLD